ncbi:MAG TPA: ATP-binding protein [Methylococcus sp.]|nr:ATP-binding protein [Methylococcus sp.]
MKEAVKLAELVLSAENPIGEIVGPAGTGKSLAGRAVAERFGAIRIAAWDGMTKHQMGVEIAQAFGLEGPGVVDRLLRDRSDPNEDARRLVVIDEANKLSWRVLELLRYLADECNVAVLLIGTELYERKFTDARTRPLLVQLGSRIGAKRVATRHLDRAETYAHILRPAFGDLTDKELVTTFWTACRKGNFRDGVELAEECRRIMTTNEMQTLTPAVMELAAKWMANRHAVEG